MARFMAIPVGQGDAFYLERENWSVLVDGGRNRHAFPQMFHRITGTTSVDVLVCTHNDADHAEGVIGFLESDLRCDEVWLPRRWLDVLPRALDDSHEVLDRLVNEVHTRGTGGMDFDELDEVDPFESLGDRLSEREERAEREEGPRLGEDGWPEESLDALERSASLYSGALPLDPYFEWHLRPAGRRADRRVTLLWSAIEAASRIRDIATSAYHRGIPVRWFEHDTRLPGGGTMHLQPLNSRRIATTKPTVEGLLALLALTVANRESLAMWSPSTSDSPGVLFSADSDLRCASPPESIAGAIATAPHHGSEANANAYSVVNAWAGSGATTLTWVRSDGRYRSRPGSSYLAAGARRLCTICRLPLGGTSAKQPVRLFARGGHWARHHSAKLCTCHQT